MNEKTMDVLKRWDIGEVESIEKLNSLFGRTHLISNIEKNKYIFKENYSFREKQIKLEYKLLSSLKEHSIPVAVPIANRKGDYYLEIENRYFCLYPFLSGNIISNHYKDDAEKRAKLYGEVIGNLHLVLKEFDDSFDFPEMNFVDGVLAWAKQLIEKNYHHFDSKMVNPIIEDLKKEFSFVYKELPKQLIHVDPHPGNILLQNGNLSGILDFEEVAKGVRIWDPCFCATEILATGFDEAEKRAQWINLLSALFSGYNGYIQLSPIEIDYGWYVLLSVQIYCTAWWFGFRLETGKLYEKALYWIYENRKSIEKSIKNAN